VGSFLRAMYASPRAVDMRADCLVRGMVFCGGLDVRGAGALCWACRGFNSLLGAPTMVFCGGFDVRGVPCVGHAGVSIHSLVHQQHVDFGSARNSQRLLFHHEGTSIKSY